MADEGLPELAADDIAEIAGKLTITDFVTGARRPWVPSPMQLAAWQFSERNRRGFIGKPRRAYISTAFDLEDALQTVVADSAGHRVRTGIMLDTEEKVTERMWQCADFLAQLGLEHRATDYYIELPGGSEIVGLTAGGKRAAASTGFQRMRYSEASYYTDPESLTSTSASVGKLGREMIETTIDIGAANGKQARTLWDDPKNDFETLFLPFEMHPEYRADPTTITDEEWAAAQAEGFTMRESAAYWYREIIPNKCAGDVVKAMHEYPQMVSHMFSSSTGLWVRKRPEVVEPVEVVKVIGPSGELWPVEIYVRPADCVGEFIIGVDVAAGLGVNKTTGVERDSSVVAVVDRTTRKMVACMASSTIPGDDTAKVAWAMWQHYTKPNMQKPLLFANDVPPNVYPRVCIEANGIGGSVTQPASRIGLPHEAFSTTDVTKYNGLLEAKRAVEAGILAGPAALRDECDELHRDVHGKWKGRKDILMAYGFCATRITASPNVVGPTHVVQDEHTIALKDRIRRYARQGGRR